MDAEQKHREKLLDAMAPSVSFKPVDYFCRLKASSSYTYASQGYGACTYARGALLPWKDHLERLGFETHIRTVNARRGTGRFAVDHADFELWANCKPWMFDAACRLLSLAEGVASLKSRAINPLVYNPFLPDSCRL